MRFCFAAIVTIRNSRATVSAFPNCALRISGIYRITSNNFIKPVSINAKINFVLKPFMGLNQHTT